MQFPARFRKSLVTRVLLLNVTMALCSLVITGVFFILAIRGVVLDQLEHKAADVCQAFASRAQFPLLAGDQARLKAVAEEFLGLQDVLFVVITGRQGAAIRLTRPSFRESMIPKAPTMGVVRKTKIGSALIFDVVYPVAAESSAEPPLGSVHLALLLTPSKDAARAAIRSAVFASLFCLSFVLWLQFVEFRRLVQPLRRLAEFTLSGGSRNPRPARRPQRRR